MEIRLGDKKRSRPYDESDLSCMKKLSNDYEDISYKDDMLEYEC